MRIMPLLRRRATRAALSLFLLTCFAPSLLFCGGVGASQALLYSKEPAPVVNDAVEYTPVIPPDSISGFFSETGQTTSYLADLPIDQVLARDLLGKLLGAFFVEFNDELVALFKSFGIDLPADFTTLPVKFLLRLIKFRSYNQELAETLLTQWQQEEMTPAREEALKRLFLSQVVMKKGFDASLAMAEDASEGLYDLVDLVFGATNVIKKLSERFEGIPVIGGIIRKIRIMISQRIIFALNNGVELVTRRMKEPRRSRTRAVFTAITTTYIKWANIKIGDGFGGISPAVLTKIGVKVLGKFFLLMSPRIGFVSLTKGTSQYGAEAALQEQTSGTFEEAAVRVLDDGNDATEDGLIEKLDKTTARKQRLSAQERRAANVAGAISQIAQLVNFIDPSGIARAVAILAGVVAGGLQLHTVFNSAIHLYRIPGQMRAGTHMAFDPSYPAVSEPVDTRSIVAANQQFRAMMGERLQADREEYQNSLDQLAAALRMGGTEPLEEALEGAELASLSVRQSAKMLSSFVVDGEEGDHQMGSFIAEGMIHHDLDTAALYADVLTYEVRPDPLALPHIEKRIKKLQQETDAYLVKMLGVAEEGQMYDEPRLEILAPVVVRKVQGSLVVKAKLISVGAQPAEGVQVKLAAPKGYSVEPAAPVQVGNVASPDEVTMEWTLSASGEVTPGGAYITVHSANAPHVSQAILITE